MRKAISAGTAAIAGRPRLENAAACLPASPDAPGPKPPVDLKPTLPRAERCYLTRLERTELVLVETIVGLRHLRDGLQQLGRLDLEPEQTRMVLAQAVEFLDLIGNPKLD